MKAVPRELAEARRDANRWWNIASEIIDNRGTYASDAEYYEALNEAQANARKYEEQSHWLYVQWQERGGRSE